MRDSDQIYWCPACGKRLNQFLLSFESIDHLVRCGVIDDVSRDDRMPTAMGRRPKYRCPCGKCFSAPDGVAHHIAAHAPSHLEDNLIVDSLQ